MFFLPNSRSLGLSCPCKLFHLLSHPLLLNQFPSKLQHLAIMSFRSQKNLSIHHILPLLLRWSGSTVLLCMVWLNHLVPLDLIGSLTTFDQFSSVLDSLDCGIGRQSIHDCIRLVLSKLFLHVIAPWMSCRFFPINLNV